VIPTPGTRFIATSYRAVMCRPVTLLCRRHKLRALRLRSFLGLWSMYNGDRTTAHTAIEILLLLPGVGRLVKIAAVRSFDSDHR
jgi:hypothetical protein